jgi:hypothetical protein
VCGADVRAATAEGQSRRRVYAAHPGEPLLSFNIVTSLMPLASGTTPQTYRTVLAVGLAIPVVGAILGALPFALAAAAVVVPVTYLLYLYDVNEWEDQPVPVVAAAVGLAGVLALGFTLLWRDVLLDGPVEFLNRSRGAEIDGRTLLVVGLLVPVVGEVLKQLGPLWLASRPQFDDLIDGLTFGVAAGAAFAATETLVLNHHLLLSGQNRVSDPDAALWVSLVVVAALVKPIVYGAATGIACAAYSGLGEGYDGFTPRYYRALAEAVGANVAFQVGLYLASLAGGATGAMLGLAWGLLVAVALLLRLRWLLHTALLEAALEAAQRDSVPRAASRDVGFCSECELPLLHESSFCSACGAAVRAASKASRRLNATSSSAEARS